VLAFWSQINGANGAEGEDGEAAYHIPKDQIEK